MLPACFARSSTRPGSRSANEPRATLLFSSSWPGHGRSATVAFLRGYYETKGIEDLLPPEAHEREAVRVAFELDKALYELAYEQAYRPDWVPIPLAAL